jgi:hypothetical protein
MTPQQKQLIRALVQKYSEHIGTESLLAYLAETNGMRTACKTLLQTIKTGDSFDTDWLFRDCLKYNIVFHLFVEEISRLIVLFDTGRENEDHFATLDISPGADKDEIKQTYRTLSPQHHPDTASPLHRDKSEKFIEINKSYNALLTAEDTEDRDEKNTPSKQWRKNRVGRSSIGQKKKLFMWASATLVTLAIVSIIVLIIVKNKAILAGLQRGRTVFVESVDTVLKSIQPEIVTDSSHEQQRRVEQNGFATPSSTEKPSLARQDEQTKDLGKAPLMPISEQLPPEPVTTINNDRLPGAQKLPAVIKPPDRIDTQEAATTVVKQPLENKPSVVNQTEVVTDSSYEKQRAIEQNGVAPPSSSEKPLLAAQEEQIEQLSPEPATIANENKSPNTQTIPVETIPPDRIDTQRAATTVVKQPLENKPSVVNQTKQHLESMSAPPDTSTQNPADNLPIEKKQIKPDIQPRISTFLNSYIKAYQQRNLTLFSKLFEADAVENGKPFTSLLPTYRELFAATSDITLKLDNISWKELEEEIALQGSFKLDLQYNDSRKFSGTGSIRFTLVGVNTSFRISALEYDFVDEN